MAAVWRRLLDRAGPSRPPAHRRCRPSSTRGRPAGRGPRTDRPHPRIPSARGAIEPEHRIAISQGARFRTIDASDERLDDGFHAFEAAEGYRWTDGLASLPTDIFADITGPFEVALSIGATASYLEYTDRRHVA